MFFQYLFTGIYHNSQVLKNKSESNRLRKIPKDLFKLFGKMLKFLLKEENIDFGK